MASNYDYFKPLMTNLCATTCAPAGNGFSWDMQYREQALPQPLKQPEPPPKRVQPGQRLIRLRQLKGD